MKPQAHLLTYNIHCHTFTMRIYDWNVEKNRYLKETRGVSFEEIVAELRLGNELDTLDHTNGTKYPKQKIFLINIKGYVHIVPFVIHGNEGFLKTIIPSRKYTKLYLNGKRNI